MPSSKREAEDVRALCAQIHPDDGIDPREDKRREVVRTTRHDYKMKQLCKQVANALQLVLPNLQMTEVIGISSVEPAPNAGRLRVMVAVIDSCDSQQVIAQLDRFRSCLRKEVAQAISRRRVPELVFSIITESMKDA